jgi:hypothetical protein
MSDHELERDGSTRVDDPEDVADDWDGEGEDEVPSAVLYVIAGLLVLSFTLYLIVGGGHSHFH